MTAQSDFFNQQDPLVLNDNDERTKPGKRLFVYDGQYFEDPGPEFSTEDVMGFLAQTYPELAHGSWHSRTLPDGTEEITFVKVAGEKGTVIRSLRARLETFYRDRLRPRLDEFRRRLDGWWSCHRQTLLRLALVATLLVGLAWLWPRRAAFRAGGRRLVAAVAGLWGWLNRRSARRPTVVVTEQPAPVPAQPSPDGSAA